MMNIFRLVVEWILDQVKAMETEPDLEAKFSVLYDKTAGWTSEYAFDYRAILSFKDDYNTGLFDKIDFPTDISELYSLQILKKVKQINFQIH